MTDRNWEAELAKIDKQLASISDEQLVAEKRAAQTRPAAGPPSAVAGPQAPARSVAPERGRWRGWVQTAVAVGAGASLMFWPWPPRCGVPLYGFVGACAGVSLLGMWSAHGTWKHRLGIAHMLSLGVVLWGLVIGAREVLPRVGYAIPDATRGASWSCTAPAPVPAPPDATQPGTTTPTPETPGTTSPSSTPPAGNSGATDTPTPP